PQTGEKNDVSRYLVDFLGEEKLEQNYESRMVLGLHENRFSWRRYKDDKDYKLLNSFFPLMSNFSKAIKGRYLEEENQFRAYLKEVPEDMVFSPSGLKKLFACSYGFLLDEIFKLKHFDYSERNVFEWLDPGTVGNLFHEIFYRTFAEGKASLVKIKEIADEEIKKARELLASPSEYAYQAFYKKMMAELEGFAEEGFIFEKDYKPEYFEVGVGTKRGKDPRKNFQDPVEYQGIKLKGVIDRIDSDGAGNFIIIDYKTGSLRKPKKDDEFLKGDHIQHVLYPIMFRKAFGDELAIEKISSGYYFSSRRAFFTQTHFKKHEEESRKSFDLFMEPFIEAYRKGEFFNNANKACRFCENKPVCNDAKVKKW
ncbi:MAG: PD-(D/E)XK nuclease family protein, partial [Elusimicrobia bacterium]|nr:PD-(D/E)XK nuclease family protein [Elusimicrobiota bacterium]